MVDVSSRVHPQLTQHHSYETVTYNTELFISGLIWVLHSDWSVKIQLKVTCARPSSPRVCWKPHDSGSVGGSSSMHAIVG